MGRKQTRVLLGVTVLLLGAGTTPASPRAAESLGRLALLVERAAISPRPTGDRGEAIKNAAEIATELDWNDVERADWTAADVDRVRKQAWFLATMKKESVEIRLDALETSLALARLNRTDVKSLALRELLADPSPEMRAAVLELAPAAWIAREHALLTGLIIGDADAWVAATAGAVFCKEKDIGDVTGELQGGMLTRLTTLLGDESVPMPARLGSALCVARKGSADEQKILGKFLTKVPKRLSAAFKKQAKSAK